MDFPIIFSNKKINNLDKIYTAFQSYALNLEQIDSHQAFSDPAKNRSNKLICLINSFSFILYPNFPWKIHSGKLKLPENEL